jgi:hypothetical protein
MATPGSSLSNATTKALTTVLDLTTTVTASSSSSSSSSSGGGGGGGSGGSSSTTAPATTVSFLSPPAATTDDAVLAAGLVNSTVDGERLFWSVVYTSIAVSLFYIVLSSSFFVYIHAVHRKQTLKPWMRTSTMSREANLSRSSVGKGMQTIEMIDIKISGAAAAAKTAQATANKPRPSQPAVSASSASSDPRVMDLARLRICREIVSTEVSYTRSVDTIVDFYLARLETSFKYDKILPRSDVDIIFRHVAGLQKLHRTLLDKMDETAKQIHAEAEKKAAALAKRVGNNKNRTNAPVSASAGSGTGSSGGYSGYSGDTALSKSVDRSEQGGRTSQQDAQLKTAAVEAILRLDSLDFVFDVYSEMIPFFRAYTAFCNNVDLAQSRMHECE